MTQTTESTKQSRSQLVLPIIIGITAVSLIALAASAVWYLYRSNAPVSQITVDGSAKRSIKPTKASITLIYEETGDSVQTLNTNADNVLKKVSEYLKNQGIDDKNIVTNKQAPYDYYPPVVNPSGKEEMRKRIEATIDVTFENVQSDLQKPNKVLDETIALGINRFGGFRYDLGDTKALCEELENEAIEAAYQKGEKRVKALGGGTIVRRQVGSTSGCGGGGVYPMYMGRAEAVDASKPADSSSVPKLSTGEQEIQANVQVMLEYR